MTDRRTTTLAVPGRRSVALATIALFVLVTAFLALRMAQGRDPALGASSPPAPAARRVVVRKVVVTHHVLVIRPAAQATPAGAPPAAAAPTGAPAAAAPQTQTAAPPVVAQPAPVQTATS